MNTPRRYHKQVFTVIEAVCAAWQDELKAAQAARTTALTACDYAAEDKQSAVKEMTHKAQLLAVALKIEEMAARTQLLTQNLTLFANDSKADAEQTRVAVTEAATLIKEAGSAMEVLTQEAQVLGALTKSNDSSALFSKETSAAIHVVVLSMKAMDKLYSQALKCSISAAMPLAGSVAETFSVLRDQVVSFIADTTQALDLARQEFAASAGQRTQTWHRFYTAVPPCERHLQQQNGLIHNLAEAKLAAAAAELTPNAPATHKAKHPTFDKGAQSMIDTLKQQLLEAGHAKNTAQATVDALQMRESTVKALLSRANSNSSSAEHHLSAGRLVTQTVLNGHGHAAAAQHRAEEIRQDMRKLCQLAVSAAVHVADTTQALDDLASLFASSVAKNTLIASNVPDKAREFPAMAQAALSSTLAALQVSMAALASAEVAVPAAATVTREASQLLKQLLPQAITEDVSGPASSIGHFKLVPHTPPALDQVVQGLEQSADKGLLYLVEVIRLVQEDTRTQMNKLASEVGMELNASKHALEKASQLYDNLQASVHAAMAAA